MLKKLKNNESGQGLVEFALVLPILILVACGIIDCGWMFYNQLNVIEACREGARYACVNTDPIYDENQNTMQTNYDMFVSDVTAKISDALVGPDKSTLKVDIAFYDINEAKVAPLSLVKDFDGDLVIDVSVDMNFLTPVIGTMYGGMTRTLQDSTRMKVEN